MVENIRYFVMPLRAKHLNNPSPIVILHTELPSQKQWLQLCHFSQIYFVQGSPLNEDSYVRANISKAKQVVILTPAINSKNNSDSSNDQGDQNTEGEDQNDYDTENLRDAKTIFMYNIIKKSNPNVNVVTELINQDNISYMLDDPLLYYLQRKYLYD